MAEPTDDRIDTSAGDSVTVRIAAPPERIYAIVTDIENMGRLSPECTGGRWLAGATGPRVGARFKGTNKRGLMRWSTTNLVVDAAPDSRFAFETKQSGARWRYVLEPDGYGTLVTHTRHMSPHRQRSPSVPLQPSLREKANPDTDTQKG